MNFEVIKEQESILEDYAYPKSWKNNAGFIYSMLINIDKIPNLHPST